LGSTVLVGICVALYRKYVSKAPVNKPILATAQQIAHSFERASTEPTPIQIDREIRAALPFDREHVRERYRGLNVTWKVHFASVRSEYDTSIKKDGTIDRNQYWVFTCLFPVENPDIGVSFDLKTVPPELKLLNAGSKLWVQGIIKKVTEFGIINLEDNPVILEAVRQ
jgi:hypothetical protein